MTFIFIGLFSSYREIFRNYVLNESHEMAEIRDKSRDFVGGIEITREMIEAGVYELREKKYGERLESIVEDVFWVMISALPTK